MYSTLIFYVVIPYYYFITCMLQQWFKSDGLLEPVGSWYLEYAHLSQNILFVIQYVLRQVCTFKVTRLGLFLQTIFLNRVILKWWVLMSIIPIDSILNSILSVWQPSQLPVLFLIDFIFIKHSNKKYLSQVGQVAKLSFSSG